MSTVKFLKTYFKNIHDVIQQGDAREESFYSALEGLLADYASATNRNNVHITVMPKKTEAGNPDFRVWDGKQHIVGYIEAKDPSMEYLDQIETAEQLQRYIGTFPNVMLTNFFEFRLYRNGTMVNKVLVAKPFVAYQLKSVPPIEKAPELLELFDRFFSFSLPKTYTAESLAVELAKRTRFLRDEVVVHELEDKARRETGNVFGFYDAFRKFLLGSLTKDEFADLYAQAIVYGLFAARTRSDHNFTRRSAFDRIPQTIGILRDIFRYISLEEMSPQMESIIDDISEVLAVTDVKQILHRFYHEGKGSDPVVHFYETFLSEYDSEERERRGVYYTPESVVSYIVRSLNLLLKEKFGKVDGLADDDVTLLDPAAGTMTFVAQACQIAVEGFTEKYGSGDKHGFIKDHILENFYAFELMMAPYAVGHLKMSFFLEELGYELQKDERFKFYLTNTLDMKELEQTSFPVLSSLSEESHKAGEIKKDKPILVILGNPPYSVSSVNKSDFIEREMYLYKQAVRSEKNIQPLSDDYIKFIRFAHWKIDQAGKGAVGMITNNSYLSGLIHRGMREELLKSFDEIYVLNLHGNARIGETSPDGSKDQNVFDIMQGVSIALFVKHVLSLLKGVRRSEAEGTTQDEKPAKIFYQDLYGLRQKKRDYLSDNDVKTTDWIKLTPTEPYYFFVPKDFDLMSKYEQGWSVTDIFPVHSGGIETGKDKHLIAFEIRDIEEVMQTIADSSVTNEELQERYGIRDTSGWPVSKRRKALLSQGFDRTRIVLVNYRPMDWRYTYFSDFLRRTQKKIMSHMLWENLGLICTRQQRGKTISHFLITDKLQTRCSLPHAPYIVSPLYLYPDTDKKDLFSELAESQERKPNLNPELVKTLYQTYGKEPTPEEIFYYVYGVLYSNIYREKYAEFLKIDFPCIPFTTGFELFLEFAEFGKRLVELHLLRSFVSIAKAELRSKHGAELDPPLAKFQGEGDKRVAKNKRAGRRYEPAESNFKKFRSKSPTPKRWVGKTGFSERKGRQERVYINKEQYFENVPQEVWEYQIGGYQVLDKWLKDRKERVLSNEEIKHYCRVVTAFYKTIQIQEEIDARYPNVEEKIKLHKELLRSTMSSVLGKTP